MRIKRPWLSLIALPATLLPFLTAQAQGQNTSTTFIPVDNERAGSDDSAGGAKTQDGAYERAIIRSVRLSSEQTSAGVQQKQQYTVEFLSGELDGKTQTLSSDVESSLYGLEPREGDKVVVLIQPNPAGGNPLVYLEGFDRRGAVFWLIAMFVLMLVLLAGWQGMKVAFSILLSVALIGWILVPAFLKGLNPVPVAIALSALLTGISSVLAVGWNKKSWVTIVGTMGGVIVAYAISHIFSAWAHLGGLATEEDRMFFQKNPLLDPRGLMFAGVIIAAMGVVEDVAVSISSGVAEVRRANSRLSLKELFRSGMVVGRDHMSALANTLIFAYVGASLSSLLLYTQYGESWLKFLNFDVVVDEVIRSLAGTIGLIFTVPITALLAAVLYARSDKRPEH